jgi:BlaI family transcriptional regulator, penicillinase repressor
MSTESPDPPKISDAEWTVMRVVWSLQEATSAQITETLEGMTEWSPRTVRTLLGRLVKKGALGYQELGREYLYHPLIDEKNTELEASRSFLDRVFDGKLAPFLATFVESGNYSPEDLKLLQEIVERSHPNPEK